MKDDVAGKPFMYQCTMGKLAWCNAGKAFRVPGSYGRVAWHNA